MNRKQAKSLLAYAVLALVLIIASVVLANAVITFSGNDPLASYRLITEPVAGRAYTPFPFTEAHLPYCITPSNSLSSAIPVTKDDIVQTFNYASGADQSVLKEISTDYLVTETYLLDVPVYGTCESGRINNESGLNETVSYECTIGTTQVQKTKEVWKPLKDISQLNLEAGKEQCFDIRGTLEPRLHSNFAVDVIPVLKLQNKEFVLSEFAWWNQSGTNYRMNHTGNYAYTNATKNMPCLINSSWGFGDGTVKNYVWARCDYNNTVLYYNNMSDFYVVNESGAVQLSMETEGKSGTRYNYNPRSVWDNFTLVIFPNESVNDSIDKIIPSGQINDEVRFASCGSGCTGYGTATSGLIKINNDSYVGTALNFSGVGANSARLNSSSDNYDCKNCTFEFIFKTAVNTSADNVVFFWRTSGGTNGFGEITFGDLNFRVGADDCIYDANLIREKWYYVVFATNNNANRSIYVNGNLATTCTVGTNSMDVGTIACVGSNCYDGSTPFKGTIDMVRFSNVTRSTEWIQRQYETIIQNYSRLSAQEIKPTQNTTTEIQGDTAILNGILLSSINTSYTNYSDQQIYSRNITGTQTVGKFDVVASSGNQRWAFNYISINESTSNFTRMVNITPSLYIWEVTNLTGDQITSQVTAFINSTKV